jgi:NADP-dependent 3-hydroxy acid dehydrogenase YdfG
MENLNDKIIIVAGGTGGIGSQVCRMLSRRGATVVVASRRRGEFIEELGAAGAHCIWKNADLRFHESWEALIAEVIETYARLDAVVHCEGMLVPGAYDQRSPAEIERVVRTNVLSVLYGTRCAIPVMKRQGGGEIVVLGSLGGMVPMAHEALYSATKFAVRGFCLALQEELRGTQVRLSLISPSSVRTPMLDLEAEDSGSTISFVTPPISPETVAAAMVDLLEHPQREVVLPRWAGLGARGVHTFPGVLSLLTPLLDRLGRNGQRRYRAALKRSAS